MLPRRRRTAALVPALTLALSGLAVVLAPSASAAPPANDNLSGATALTPGTKVSSTLVDATREGAEPQTSCEDTERTVWFSWTAPALSAGTARIETSGASPVDTVIGVWTGASAMYPLTALTCDDEAGAGNFSRATFTVTPGQKYWFQVGNYTDGASPATPGAFDITLTVPLNDDLADAQVVSAGNPSTTLSVSTVNATLQTAAGEVGQPNGFCSSIRNSIWYKITPIADGTFTATTTQTSIEVDTQLQLWSGPASGPTFPLTAVGCNDDTDLGVFSQLTASVTGGQTYYLQVTNYALSEPGSFDLKIEPPQPVPPGNDGFTAAAPLTLPSTVTINNMVATTETGEPTPVLGDCTTIGKTAWYSFTPAAGVGVTVDTLSSPGGDSVLGIYSGPTGATAFDQLTPVACNDDSGFGVFRSKVDFFAGSGATYYIQLGSFDPGAGANFTLKLTPYAATPTSTALDAVRTGRQVDLAATVTPFDAGDPLTGNVVFTDGATTIATVPLSATTGTAAHTVTVADPGHHDYRATFQSSDFKDSSSASPIVGVDVTVDTTTTLTGSATGRTENFTATVTGPAGTTPVGKVQLFQDTTFLVEATLVSGSAPLQLTDIPLGKRTYHAVYVPATASGYLGSTSSDVDVTVSEQTVLTLNGSASGSTVTLDAAQATAAGSQFAQGSVEFFEGPTSKGVVNLSGVGTAQLVLTGVAPGVHTYRAVFTPQAGSGYLSATSADRPVTVPAAPPPAKVASTTTVKAPKAVKSGKAPKITITVKRGAAAAAGQVTIEIGKTVFKTVALAANGTVKVKLPKQTKKAKVTVGYLGNATTLPSSARATIKILKP